MLIGGECDGRAASRYEIIRFLTLIIFQQYDYYTRIYL